MDLKINMFETHFPINDFHLKTIEKSVKKNDLVINWIGALDKIKLKETAQMEKLF